MRQDMLAKALTHGYQPKPVTLDGQQLLMAQLAALGLANKEIAYFVCLSEVTVKRHISGAIHSLGLVRRTQLCRYIFENGLTLDAATRARLGEKRVA